MVKPVFLCTIGLIALAIMVGDVAPAHAQLGQCPPNGEGIWPAPPGTTPASLTLCNSVVGGPWDLWYDAELPCGGQFYYNQPTITGGSTPPIWIVPPSGLAFPSSRAKLDFYVNSEGIGGIYQGEIILRITSYDFSGAQIEQKTETINSTNYTATYTAAATIYTVTGFEILMVQGGYIGIEVRQPAWIFGWGYTYFSSFAILDSAAASPQMCNIPAPTPTITATPANTATGTATPSTTPTGTIAATNTPNVTNTHTPMPAPTRTPTRTPTATAAAGTATLTTTPWPTSAGGTRTPAPSVTAYVYTVVTPVLATRISLPTLTSLELPSIVVPTLANPAIPTALPGSTSVASVTLVSGTAVPNSTAIAAVNAYTDGIEEILVAYESDLAEAEVLLDERFAENVIYVETQVQYLEFPVRLVRAMQSYMPNLWPVLLTMFYSVLLMFLTSMVQIGTVVFSLVVRAGSWLMGWLFRLWEAIPFIN